eukprot:scaffold219910_cov102-Cyclotella_meneghiniana.AAC.1
MGTDSYVGGIPTLPIYQYKYNEWLEKVESGIHQHQFILHNRHHTPAFESQTDSANSQHLIPSNLSSQ